MRLEHKVLQARPREGALTTGRPTCEQDSAYAAALDSKLVPDIVRQDFCVPDINQQDANVVIVGTGHKPGYKLMRATT